MRERRSRFGTHSVLCCALCVTKCVFCRQRPSLLMPVPYIAAAVTRADGDILAASSWSRSFEGGSEILKFLMVWLLFFCPTITPVVCQPTRASLSTITWGARVQPWMESRRRRVFFIFSFSDVSPLQGRAVLELNKKDVDDSYGVSYVRTFLSYTW